MLIVRAYPRLHFGLLDLGGATARAYGGAGLMLDALPTEVAVSTGDTTVRGLEQLDQLGRDDINAAIARMESYCALRPSTLTLRCAPPQHVGLGTKTCIILSALKALESYNGLELGTRRLQLLSGRGGTSGIGIHGFFEGGFIIDAGHRADSVTNHCPSGARLPPDVPLVAVKFRVSDDWRFALILAEGRRYSGCDEHDFFKNNTPLPASEVKDAIAITYHGIAPAVFTCDVKSLKLALREMHRCAFKKRELQGQSERVQKLFADLDRIPDCAVGLSSLGPLVYAVIDDGSSEIRTDVALCAARHNAQVLAFCPARNQGYEFLL